MRSIDNLAFLVKLLFTMSDQGGHSREARSPTALTMAIHQQVHQASSTYAY